jgi:hypothetical protein
MAEKKETNPIFDLYVSGLKAQRRANRNYWVNAAFLQGDQWIFFSPETNTLSEVPNTEDRVRATINKLWPGSRTVISKLVQRPLAFEVRPNSSDDVAIEGAKISESIIYAVAREHEWESLRESVAWAAWKGGTGAVCVDWNPTKGKPVALSSDGATLSAGDTQETALSIPEFVIQPGARVAREAHWWIKAQALPPAQLKADYNLDEEPNADATTGLSSLERGLVGSLGSGLHGPQADRDNLHDTPLALVLTYYERPNPNCKEGKVEVVINNKTVWGPKPWPFPFKDHLNISTCRETIKENTWIGDTVVTVARPVQAAFNAAWSNILEHADVAGNARMVTPQSSVELTEQYTDIVGEQIVYADGMDKPDWMTPPQLPGWLLQMPGELSAEIDNILGVHDVSRGSAPANIESGYGLAVLAEQDATPIGKLAGSMARMFGEVASDVLAVYADNVKEKRTAVVVMPGEPAQTTTWSGDDIAGQTTATVPIELVAPRSAAAQAQMAQKMMEMGLITSIEELTRLSEAPGERQIVEAVRPDVARARRENAEMAQGNVQLPEDWDDHQIHIKEHNDFRKTARYERLPKNIRDIYASHVQAHETLGAEGAARQQQAMNVGGPALAATPKADGSEVLPVSEAPLPPPDEQTVLDQLAGDPAAALAAADAQAMAEGAAITQGDMERDAMLALTEIATGGGIA